MTKAGCDPVFLYALSKNMYYDKAMEFDALYKAMKKCCKNLRWKDSVIGYESNGLKNTYRLRQSLLDGTYEIQPYQRFIIFEPKRREIVATRFRDRQVQMSLCRNGMYDDFIEHFISDNPACQLNKGTDYTLDRITAHLRRYHAKYGVDGYVLKMDIKKFFPSTNHNYAKNAVAKHLKDKAATEMVFKIIDSFDTGIGLGSQVSQLIELCILDDLDHFIKERLRIKHYIRYMDDMIIIHHNRDYLEYCLKEIRTKLRSIGFTLNSKTQIYPLKQGILMMKWHYHITDSGKIIRSMHSSKTAKQRRKIRKLFSMEEQGLILPGTTKESLNSWLANAERGNTYYKRKRMIEYYREITGDSTKL